MPPPTPEEDERKHPLYYDWSVPKYYPFKTDAIEISDCHTSKQVAASSCVKDPTIEPQQQQKKPTTSGEKSSPSSSGGSLASSGTKASKSVKSAKSTIAKITKESKNLVSKLQEYPVGKTTSKQGNRQAPHQEEAANKRASQQSSPQVASTKFASEIADQGRHQPRASMKEALRLKKQANNPEFQASLKQATNIHTNEEAAKTTKT